MAEPIRVYDMIDCVVGAKRTRFERTRVGMNRALGDATKVFERVATWCAKEGILADLSRAHWFIDYDVRYLTDRVVVRAPLQGVQGPVGPPAGARLKGSFNEQMRAMIWSLGKKGMGEAWRRNNQEIRQLIAAEEDFVAKNGNLVGDYVDGLLPTFEGLTGEDAERYFDDAPLIRYAVWSYGWPIYWVTDEGDEYTIAHPPSKTTAGHRNLCPGYKQTREA